MNELLAVAVAILAVLVLGLIAAVFALARQAGILYERVAPVGALTMDAGPKVGDLAPAFDLVGLAGERVEIGKPTAVSTLLCACCTPAANCLAMLPVPRMPHFKVMIPFYTLELLCRCGVFPELPFPSDESGLATPHSEDAENCATTQAG
jgi:hypothetical protein